LYAAYPRLGRLLANFLVQRKNGIGDKVLSLGVMNGIDPEIARIFFADKAVLKKLRSGERLIEQGKKTAGVYAVMRGSVALDQTGSCAQTDPIELDDTSLTQGLFGERSVIMNEGAVCTVTAKRNVTTLFVHKRDFREFLDRYPQLLRNCLDRITDYSRSNEKRASLIAALKKRMSPS
jgi:CRP-like cAMP-binding protein